MSLNRDSRSCSQLQYSIPHGDSNYSKVEEETIRPKLKNYNYKSSRKLKEYFLDYERKTSEKDRSEIEATIISLMNSFQELHASWINEYIENAVESGSLKILQTIHEIYRAKSKEEFIDKKEEIQKYIENEDSNVFKFLIEIAIIKKLSNPFHLLLQYAIATKDCKLIQQIKTRCVSHGCQVEFSSVLFAAYRKHKESPEGSASLLQEIISLLKNTQAKPNPDDLAMAIRYSSNETRTPTLDHNFEIVEIIGGFYTTSLKPSCDETLLAFLGSYERMRQGDLTSLQKVVCSILERTQATPTHESLCLAISAALYLQDIHLIRTIGALHTQDVKPNPSRLKWIWVLERFLDKEYLGLLYEIKEEVESIYRKTASIAEGIEELEGLYEVPLSQNLQLTSSAMLLVSTYGIEVEYFVPYTDWQEILEALCKDARIGWTFTQDRTIKPNTRSQIGIEAISPIIVTEKDLKIAELVIGAINTVGGRVNDSCGLHIHIGFDTQLNKNHPWLKEGNFRKKGEVLNEEGLKLEILKQFILNYYLDAKLGGSDKEGLDSILRKNNEYARSSMDELYGGSIEKMTYKVQDTKTIEDLMEAINPNDRNWMVNLRALAKHGTVEIRHHNGSVDPKVIIPWLQTINGYLESVIKVVVKKYYEHGSSEMMDGLLEGWKKDENKRFEGVHLKTRKEAGVAETTRISLLPERTEILNDMLYAIRSRVNTRLQTANYVKLYNKIHVQ